MIETKRLILRRFTMEDAEDACEMNRDPLVNRHLVGEGKPSLEQTRKLIKDNTLADYGKYGYGRMAVILRSENKFIGFAGLKYLDDMNEVDVGYRLNSSYWGKGYATEAARATMVNGFNELGIDRIIARALPENEASIQVMKKLGMKFEKMMEVDGYEVVFYAVNKIDFESFTSRELG